MRDPVELYQVLVLCVLLSCAASWIIAHRYRRRMQQLMRAPGSGDSRPPNAPAGEATEDRPAGASVSLAENRAAGMPRESLCMNCHVAVKADSAAIIELAGFVKRKEPAPWARLYRLPDFVSFSHKRHVGKAGVACATCHGEVKNQDVLAKEKSVGMQSCMACHDQRKANNNCDACHAIHPA